MSDRRKQVIVNWAIQGRILALVLGSILLSVLIMGGFGWYCLTLVREAGGAYPAEVQAVFESGVARIMTLTVLGVLAVVLLASLLAVRFSHKITGPIYRIREDLQEMKEADKLELIYTRRNDFHKQLVRTLNNFIVNLRDESLEGD